MDDERASDLRVAEHLADHDGVITTAQALTLGMTRGQIRARRRSGLWTPHARSTHLSAEHRMTDAARIRIVSSAHTGAVIDRTAAAWLHGLADRLPDEVTASVARSGSNTPRCVVPASIRRRTYPAEDISNVRGIPVTALPLTVLTAAAELPDGIAILDRVLQTRRVTVAELRATLDRNSGIHGLRPARPILESADSLSESELERRFVRFLRKHSITGWQQQVWLGNRRLDFAWPAEQVAVSLHGWAFHHQHDRWENDQATTSALASIGWLPLVFTWKRLEYQPDEVLAELARALDLRRAVQ
ncbi:type IV toxin-antitoxin system AbiEi family antitoxin domain-containing protein [Gordonia shandongensis]|uniref:type IV toxin-antitoxin system AbiEi family antitoxin domain-containing protein n=1 Tax=Gordonia shandongensis TaxID=376351 RepID=UPI0004133C3C|nr:type IV toxin-antitoxin system AbiEi family antitoxin domain-containing protein [Gordonia shandongensis]